MGWLFARRGIKYHQGMSAFATAPIEVPRETRYPVRVLRWVRLFTHIGIGLAMVGMLFPRVTPARRGYFTGRWSAKLLRILNIILAVHGTPPATNARNLFVTANHVSWVDIFVINAAHPARFIAKSEIRDWPLIGWLCDRAGTIFIRRTRRSDTAKINDVMHSILAEGATIGLFPEGTTTNGDRLLKFHTSLFEPAVHNAATLAPAALRYRGSDGNPNKAVAFIGELSFGESVALIIRQKSMIAEITFGAPIESRGMTRRELALQAEDSIAAILGVPKPHMHQRFPAQVDENLDSSG